MWKHSREKSGKRILNKRAITKEREGQPWRKSSVISYSPEQFLEHFKNINAPASDDVSLEGNPAEDSDTLTAVFEELDAPITFLEIEKAIGRLKTGKSCAEDNLVNEIFMKCREILTPTLHTLFNSVFSSGYFPEAWAKGCIVPIFKKGQINDPNNYRGITIISHTTKTVYSSEL